MAFWQCDWDGIYWLAAMDPQGTYGSANKER